MSYLWNLVRNTTIMSLTKFCPRALTISISMDIFIKNSNFKNTPLSHSTLNGVTVAKHNDITKKLYPLLPTNKQQYLEQFNILT